MHKPVLRRNIAYYFSTEKAVLVLAYGRSPVLIGHIKSQ